MNEYNVSDYGIFSSAVATANNLKNKLAEGQNAVSQCQSVTGNAGVFSCPACDSCQDALKNCSSKLSNLVSGFTTIANYLTDTAEAYKAGDYAAQNTVLSVNGNSVEVSELSSIQHNGQIIYYNQKGYYDENGKLHRWPTTWGKSISSSGCGPTSMAAVLANMFNDPSITPTTVANMMSYNENVGGNYVIHLSKYYGLDQNCHIIMTQSNVNHFLRNDGKMIIAVNNGTHYIAVLGINDSTNPPTYIVCDPNDWNTSKKTWTYKDIASTHTMAFYIAPKGKTVNECLSGSGNTAVQV